MPDSPLAPMLRRLQKLVSSDPAAAQSDAILLEALHALPRPGRIRGAGPPAWPHGVASVPSRGG